MPKVLSELLSAGTLEDAYTVTKHLGAGAFSEVKLAKRNSDGESCAVKIMKRDHPEFNEELLVLEIEFMMRCKDHPNIVKIYDVYADRESVNIVMEQVAGGELFDIIVKRVDRAAADDPRPYTERHVASIMAQVTSAIVHCHKNMVAHRDLKPENMLIADATSTDPETPIKLADFGLSADITDSPLMHEPCGTPEYVAPEVVTRFKEGYDKACDIWSLGVIMYILLCGYAPFWGGSAQEILRRVKTSKVDFPSREWTHISPEAKGLVEKMLNRNSAMRPTADELLADPWFTGAAAATSLPSTVPNLKRFNAKRKLRAEIMAIKLDNRMQKFLLGLKVEALMIEMLRDSAPNVFNRSTAIASGGDLDQVKRLSAVMAARSADKTVLDKATFAAALTAECGVDMSTAADHFDAFCAWKDTPYIRYHEYCHACLAVLPGDRAAKVDMAFGLYDVDNSGLIDESEFSELARNMLVGQANGERQLNLIIQEEFKTADTDDDGMVSLEEWRAAATTQPRIVKYLASIDRLHKGISMSNTTENPVATSETRGGTGEASSSDDSDGGCCVVQ